VNTEDVAEAHQWLGETLLAAGEPREARRELMRSLRARPLQPRVAALAAAALLPAGTGDRLRNVVRQVKRRFA
jgi:predicted Zn-dependent protease